MVLISVFYLLLIVIAVGDWKNKKIPDKHVVILLILGITAILLGQDPPWQERMTGFIAIPLVPILCNLLRTRAFGGGDVKLLASCGFFLGWKTAIIGLALSILCCGMYCLAGILSSKKNRNSIFPFGPFICMGMIIAGLMGDSIIIWFLN